MIFHLLLEEKNKEERKTKRCGKILLIYQENDAENVLGNGFFRKKRVSND